MRLTARHDSASRASRRAVTVVFAVLIGVALGVVAGCTPEQTRFWLRWHAEDPQAALEFLETEQGQAMLAEEAPVVEALSAPRGGCDGIYDEMIRQGASDGVARRFAYSIAPRESGCTAQFVHDRDDWSYSRFGLNGITANLRTNWQAWCGADVRSHTANLSVDVRCALAAHARMGWAPWG
jgi:hypothetical protein